MGAESYGIAAGEHGNLPVPDATGLPEDWLVAPVIDPFEIAKHRGRKRKHDQKDHGNWARSIASGSPSGASTTGPVSEDMARRTLAEGGATNTGVGGTMRARTGKVVGTHLDRSRVYKRRLSEPEMAGAIQKYRQDNADLLASGDKTVGAWVDGETGYLWLDIGTIVSTAAEADTLARQHNQIAYYDIDNKKEVRTGGTGEDRLAKRGLAERLRGRFHPRGLPGAGSGRDGVLSPGGDSRGDRSGSFDPFGLIEKHGSHNQLDHGNWARGVRGDIGGSTRGGSNAPLTDEQYANRVAYIEKQMAGDYGIGGPNDTSVMHTDEDGAYLADRAAIHERIIDAELVAASERGVRADKEVILMGGLGGAGKSSFLRSGGARDFGVVMGSDGSVRSHIVINPDTYKEILVARGLVPKIPGLSPMESSHLVHEESSHIAKMLAERAGQRGMNVIWDFTLGSSGSGSSKLENLSRRGYEMESVIFIDVTVDHSKASAAGRHRRGVDDYLVSGHGDGGRFVPPAIIESGRAPAGSGFNSVNRIAYEELTRSGKIDRGMVYGRDDGADGYANKVISRYNVDGGEA